MKRKHRGDKRGRKQSSKSKLGENEDKNEEEFGPSTKKMDQRNVVIFTGRALVEILRD